MRIALKECAWERCGDVLVVVCDPSRQVELDDPEGQAEALLVALAAGPQTLEELRRRLAGGGLEVSVAELRAAVVALDGLRLVEDAGSLLPGSDGDGRYASNLAFFELFSTLGRSRAAMQERLSAAHVLQLGAGGLGTNVLPSLAGLGVGRLTLVDFDVVEARNFARQFLYRHQDVGRSKVGLAAQWVRDYDPRIQVAAVERRVEGPADVAGLLDGVDLVISGIDRPDEVDQWVNEACVSAGVPWVRGGMSGSQLVYYSVDPGRSPCLACQERSLLADMERDDATGAGIRLQAGSRRLNRGIGPAAALVSSLVAFEALRYLTGFQPPYAAGATVSIECGDGCEQSRRSWVADPDCALCQKARALRGPAMSAL